ncbi:unnamed protein product, partial [Porites evermanni]
ADDTQLYVSFRPDDANAQDEAIRAVEDCIKDVRNWLIEGRLLLNDDETESLAHCHADDTQLYVSFKPDDANAEDEAVRAMEDCIKDVTNWLIEGRLLLDDKTEFLVIRTRQQ